MATPEHRIVLVVGPGRSGTSTMAGALAQCGYEVPQTIQGNETNPSGFFEPRWVVDFHRRLLSSTGVRTLDTDPAAFDRIGPVADDEAVRAELKGWLEERLRTHDRLVIKDPRLVWFRDLWGSVSEELGVEPGFVMMLRHPSEVSSSRSEYYDLRLVTGVAGWVNVALLTESLTRRSPRALIQYADLTAEWRPELDKVRDRLGLQLEPPPDQRPHPVDSFIDPGLRRMKPGWDHVPVPGFLQELGDRAYGALSELAQHGDVPSIIEQLEGLRTEYAALHADALALVQANVSRARAEAVSKSARRARERTRARVEAQLSREEPTRGRRRRAVLRRVTRRDSG